MPIKMNRIFQGAIVCSVGLHGLLFWGLAEWHWEQRPDTRPERKLVSISKVIVQNQPAPSRQAPPEAEPPKPPMKPARFHANKKIQPAVKTASIKTPVKNPDTPTPPSSKTRSYVYRKNLVPRPVETHTPGSVKNLRAGKSTRRQPPRWQPATSPHRPETMQETFARVQAPVPPQLRYTEPTEPTNLEPAPAPGVEWTVSSPIALREPETVPSRQTAKTVNSKPVSEKTGLPAESGDGLIPQNKESERQPFASKTITGPRRSGEDLEALKNGFILAVRNRIAKSKYYPRLALRRGLEGQPIVHFTITRRGTIEDLRVAQSSGSGLLDQAALDSVQKGAPFPVIPDVLERDSMTLQLPVSFTLE